MPTAKVAITLDDALLKRVDRLVRKAVFPSRSRAIQEAVAEKLARMERSRLARECAKLDPKEERALAELGMAEEARAWPRY
ncbi:MAG: ribbon-helix-helix domain-containing protein [Planctomycetota bacterium]|nr:ribbon-helix-helix domain-containing protein [Planctomycetota bacterium]